MSNNFIFRWKVTNSEQRFTFWHPTHLLQRNIRHIQSFLKRFLFIVLYLLFQIYRSRSEWILLFSKDFIIRLQDSYFPFANGVPKDSCKPILFQPPCHTYHIIPTLIHMINLNYTIRLFCLLLLHSDGGRMGIDNYRVHQHPRCR